MKKDPRKILSLVKGAVKVGAHPGTTLGRKSKWPDDPFHILISTVLSQRTRDQNTFNASRRLFGKYGTPSEIANAPLSQISDLIRPAGFPNQKSKAIKEISRIIDEEMNGEVPRTIEGLMSLPMVGRKTANCVLSHAFHIPAICVDTHVNRIANRIGLVSSIDPAGTEEQLREIVPRDLWINVNSLLVRFGQTTCLPRKPKCETCPVTPICDYYHRAIQKQGLESRISASSHLQ